jgi:hypothetical protein
MSSDANGTPRPRGHGYITSIFLAELRDIKRQLALETPASPNEPSTTPAEPDTELVIGLIPQPIALQWSENLPPCKEFRCECIATTPFGRFLIEVKSFSGGICPIIMEVPWKDSINVKGGINPESLVGLAFWSLADAKEACQSEFNKRLLSCCAATAKQEPNNENL